MGKLSIELQKLLETKQGYDYISDAIEGMDDTEVIIITANALLKSYEITKILREFLEKIVEDGRGEKLPPF